MKAKISIAIMLAAMVAITACKKEGTGGSTTVATIVKHHEKLIPGATIYVKYGAKESPGADVSVYDESRVADAAGHAHFENLRRGDYFFYAVGYDSTINEVVKGGIPVEIKRKDKNEHIDVIVPVVE
jgi:hypothetical protein